MIAIKFNFRKEKQRKSPIILRNLHQGYCELSEDFSIIMKKIELKPPISQNT